MRISLVILIVVFSVGALVSAAADSSDRTRAFTAAADPSPTGIGGFPVGSDEEADDERPDDESTDENFAELFATDPLTDPASIVAGQALGRLAWASDEPVFAGDAPGSLTGLYDSSLPAGLFGFALPRSYSVEDTFTAAASFVIRSEGFEADPNGFFQLSWGLWNLSTTGLDRTGSLEDFASDTFELVEFDYFPNVSPFFGGPFVGPTVFGEAYVESPAFETSGAFANFTGLFDLQVGLPFDVPLLAVLEHRGEVNAMTVQVYRIVSASELLPLDGAVGVVPLELLGLRSYAVDAVGLTLWQDGFAGPTPGLVAEVTYHGLFVVPGRIGGPEGLLDAASD